jgi:cytochrome c-type biogenesis protein
VVADLVQTGLSSWWAPALAFAAGAVSFASPCVFPLVPGYISFVTGERATVTADRDTEGSRRSTMVPIVLFILGFSVVLVLLGAFSGTFVRIFKGSRGQLIGGLFVTLMGLLMLGFALGWGPMSLYAERRPLLERARPGRWSAFPLGVAFATGWTPCLGPVLTGILAIAASQGTLRGIVLLSAYSLGLGLPFLLVGLGVQRAMGAFGWVRRNYRWIAGVSGVLMVTMGLLLATGMLTRILAPLARFVPFGL